MNTAHKSIAGIFSRFILVAALLIVGHMPGYAQSNNKDCLDLVRDVYRTMEQAISAQKSFDISYTVDIRGKHRGKDFTIVTHNRMSMQGDRSMTTSDHMQAYSDSAVMVTVVPGRRTIYLTDRGLRDESPQSLDAFRKLSDAMLSSTSVTFCSDATDMKGRPCRKVTARLTPTTQQRTGMASVTWFIDKQKKVFHAIHIDHMPGAEVQSTDMVIDAITYTAGNIAGGPVLAQFCDSRMQLLPRYAGYSLIDKRLKR